MLYKSKILTLVTKVYSWYGYEYCFMGPSGHFYSFIYLLILMIGTGRTWLELPVQGRLPDFRESGRVTRYSRVFRRLTGSQHTPRFGASQLGIRA